MKRFLVGAVLGLFIGISATLVITHHNTAAITTATVTPIKGAALKINNILRTPTSTMIDTSYDGPGESMITIPTKPYRYAACAFVSTDCSVYLGGGYTWGRFTAMGGAWFRNNNGYSGGAWIGGVYSF